MSKECVENISEKRTEVKNMIERIPQRTTTDCAICAAAMVMGQGYDYERVLRDSEKYLKISEDGKFLAWWEAYLQDEGFLIEYRPFMDLYSLPTYGGHMVGLLMLDIPSLKFSHIVAVDELGIIDPADNSLPHTDIAVYVLGRINNEEAVFHPDFLAVVNPKTVNFC